MPIHAITRRGSQSRASGARQTGMSGARSRHLFSARAPLPRWTGGWSLAVLLFSIMAPVAAMELETVYRGMAAGCTYDQGANYRIIAAYVDETDAGPKLARPMGGRRLAAFFGKASLQRHGEYYTLTIPIAGATLYGIPVSQLAPYRGTGSGVAGVAITFALPLDEVKTRLAAAGVELVSQDHGWGELTPELQSAQNGSGTELICDLSM